MPALTKEASDRQAAAAQARRGRRLDNPEERGVGERCVNFGVPKLGAGYNSYYQIVQTPTHVVFMSEMAHDARIIPLDNRPFPDKKIQNWNGEPRGRWEGDTLVVESKNFSPKSEFRGSRENLHLIERFTRVGPNTLNYEITRERSDRVDQAVDGNGSVRSHRRTDSRIRVPRGELPVDGRQPEGHAHPRAGSHSHRHDFQAAVVATSRAGEAHVPHLPHPPRRKLLP